MAALTVVSIYKNGKPTWPFEEGGAPDIARDGTHVLMTGHVHDGRELHVAVGRLVAAVRAECAV